MTVPVRLGELEEAADLLVDARHSVRVLPAIPPAIRPRSLDEAYIVSDLLARKLGWEIGGWYCAATNLEIQRALGLREPYFGRLFQRLVHDSPATLCCDDFPPMVVETEVAFRLAEDLPSKPSTYTTEEVADAVGSIVGTIEVVAGHLHNWIEQDAFSVIADNGTDGALIVGRPLHDWRPLDLAKIHVEVSVNGDAVRSGQGANVLGSPLTAMSWLANARNSTGDGLKVGHIHNTGTLTTVLPVRRGDEVVADFGVLGDVRLTLT